MKKKILSLALVFCMVVSMMPAYAVAANVNSFSDKVVVKATDYAIAPGVTETNVILNDGTGDAQVMGYMTTVDLTKDVELKASYGTFYNGTDSNKWAVSGWNLTSTTKQAAAYEAATGKNVVAATNGDYFNMGTGQPLGPLVMNGVNANPDKSADEPYFAILKDGTAAIRDAGTSLADVQEAIAGPFYLLKNGQIMVGQDADLMPRNSVGLKDDGTVVMFLADGRQYPASVGMTLYDMAQFLLAQGVTTALYLDGGGSATYASEREGSGKLTVKNSPSDGVERAVSSALLVVSTAKPSGVFDHASVTPNNDLYTPGTQIQFAANGVDSAGSAAELPKDLTWSLNASSAGMGSIDPATGLFTADPNATGAVTVEVSSDGQVVGSATVQIVKPDQIYFSSEEISLGFEDTTDFGLTVRYQGMDVNIKEGDIIWSITDEKMGTFNGNTFTSSDGMSLNGDVKATSAFDSAVYGSIHVIVGMLPTVVWDFEDRIDPETGAVTPAEDYYIGSDAAAGILTHSNYGRGGKESVEIVSIDDEEPVRMGSHALKLNYNFTECDAVTEGACVGTTEAMAIPGSPTGIGVWVYAPEGVGIEWQGDGSQSGFWLRGQVKDGNGTVVPYDFTLEPKAVTGDQQPGIYWEGWKYLEADLTSKTGPFTILSGMTFRLMYVYGTNMGTKTAGSLYFDNLQFVYGANMDDVDNPVVKNITANGTELTNGAVLKKNVITFSSNLADVQNKYTSGLDVETIRMYIDGVNAYESENFTFAVQPDGSRCETYDVKLLDGEHSVTVTARDLFGNEVSETRYFTVNSGASSKVATISVAPSNAAVLGEQLKLQITASDAAQVAASKTVLKLNKDFPNYTVNFSDNYEGTTSYSNITGQLTINATRKADNATRKADAASDTNVIAEVVLDVPTTLKEGAAFTWIVKSGEYKLTDNTTYTYSADEASVAVTAPYAVSAEPVLVGQNGTVKVTNAAGQGVSGVGIYLEDGTLVGTTDADGKLTTDYFSAAAGTYTVYAKDDAGKVSFTYKVQSYAPNGADAMPFGIKMNATSDNTSTKNISWMTMPGLAGEQQLQYAEGSSTQWTSVPADTTLQTFTKEGNSAVNVHSVNLSGLKANTTYSYRVGDGTNWSEVKTFTTGKDGYGVNFFVMGDIQADDLSVVNGIMDNVAAGDYAFGIQTGDAVDDASSYVDWTGIVDLFGVDNLQDADVIQVLGNHEFSGDADASSSTAIYNLPTIGQGGYYSVEYGNVYVAVINYTSTKAQLREALDWLKEDAAKSDATWKILSMHQPPYYTNVVGGNGEIQEMVPSVVDEAGIDFVFSGHDHSYARTEPLTGGKVDKDGAVYFICASSGEKSYSITNNEEFHFALATQEYNAVYLDVQAGWNDITVTAYDVQADGTKTILDSVSKQNATCPGDEHENVYDRATGVIKCEKCGYTFEAKAELYSGWVTDLETGRKMYFVGGKYVTGYQYIASTPYYIDENGLAFEGKYTLCGETCLFDDGQFVSCSTAKVTMAGMAGENVAFVLYENGTLKLSGTGAMYDYNSYGVVPWYPIRKNITSIEIGADIVNVGAYAFRGATKCTSVTFEEGSKLTTIAGNAFYYASSLTEITLPDTVTSIGAIAFGNCTKLASIYLPDGISSISGTAFKYCDPSVLVLSVADDSYAEEYAVANGLTYVVRSENEGGNEGGNEGDQDEALYTGTTGEVIWSVYADGTLKFTGTGATEAYSKCADISWYGYRDMITAVVVGADVTVLNNYACRGLKNVTSVTFEEGSKLTTLGNLAFYDCDGLTEITLPEGLTTIGGAAFGMCDNLTKVYIPDSVISIKTTAFTTCDLTKLVLDVKKNGAGEVYAKAQGIKYTTRGSDEVVCLYTGTTGEVTWGVYSNGVLKFTGTGATAAYSKCADIPWYGYRDMITSVVVGAEVTTLNNYACRGLKNVTSVTFEKGSKLATIGNLAFYDCDGLTEITLPEGLTTIGGAAFGMCDNLAKVYIPDSVIAIKATAFTTCNLDKLVLNVLEYGAGEVYAKAQGVKHEVRKSNKVVCLYTGTTGEVTWGVYSDGSLKFTGTGATAAYSKCADIPWYGYRDMITSVVVGAEVTTLNNYACRGLKNVTSVTFEEGSKLTTLGNLAFYDCDGLTEITLPEGLTTIGGAAFGMCDNLTKVYIPDSVIAIKTTAFTTCNLDKLVLNVLEDGAGQVYAKAQGVKHEVRKSNKVVCLYTGTTGEVTWGVYSDGSLKFTGTGATAAYSKCADIPWYGYRDMITSVVVGAEVTTLNNYACRGLKNVTDVTFEEGSKLTTLGNLAFYDCDGLTEITLPEGLTTIGGAAFGMCDNLAQVYIPDSVIAIKTTAFTTCDLTKLVLSVASGSAAETYAVNNGVKTTVR